MDDKRCLICGGLLIFIETPDKKHYGKIKCAQCGAWVKWVKKPENEDKRTKTSKHDGLTESADRCGLCGRKRFELNNKETFELHHSIPLEEDGEDKMDNIVFLCTACHRQAHWIRTYFYKHLKPLTKEETP